MSAPEKVPYELAKMFDSAPDVGDSGELLGLRRVANGVTYENMHGTFVAELCYCVLYDDTVYFSRRKQESHFYQRVRGYAIDDRILFDLDDRGVEILLIGVVDDGHIYEFDIDQYLNYEDGEKFEWGDGPQRCTPLVNARHVWRDALGSALPD